MNFDFKHSIINELSYEPSYSSYENSMSFTIALSSLTISIHGDNWLVFGQQIKKILQMQLLPAFKFYNPFHHLGHNKWRLNHLPICSQDSLLWLRQASKSTRIIGIIHFSTLLPCLSVSICQSDIGAQLACLQASIYGNWNELLQDKTS